MTRLAVGKGIVVYKVAGERGALARGLSCIGISDGDFSSFYAVIRQKSKMPIAKCVHNIPARNLFQPVI